MRWPVMSGSAMRSRARMGRGTRTGHCWSMEISRGPDSVSTSARVSRKANPPGGTMERTVPLTSGGAMTRCRTNSVSIISPMPWPAKTCSPAFTNGVNCHCFAGSSGSTFSPRRIHAPL